MDLYFWRYTIPDSFASWSGTRDKTRLCRAKTPACVLGPQARPGATRFPSSPSTTSPFRGKTLIFKGSPYFGFPVLPSLTVGETPFIVQLSLLMPPSRKAVYPIGAELVDSLVPVTGAESVGLHEDSCRTGLKFDRAALERRQTEASFYRLPSKPPLKGERGQGERRTPRIYQGVSQTQVKACPGLPDDPRRAKALVGLIAGHTFREFDADGLLPVDDARVLDAAPWVVTPPVPRRGRGYYSAPAERRDSLTHIALLYTNYRHSPSLEGRSLMDLLPRLRSGPRGSILQ